MLRSNSAYILYTKLPYMVDFKCTDDEIVILQQIVTKTTDFEIMVAKTTSIHWQVNI